ncbi:MAG: hypothetical protein Q7U05_11525 [Polaromonas sp.]|nr:hypothetical protein [Polaromonas sp.]
MRAHKSGDMIAGSAGDGDAKYKQQAPTAADKKLQNYLTRMKNPVYNSRLS